MLQFWLFWIAVLDFSIFGFEKEVESSVIECEGTLTDGEKYFTSYNYPQIDDRSRICVLTVKPTLQHCGIKLVLTYIIKLHYKIK